jgi:hypothetical protein
MYVDDDESIDIISTTVSEPVVEPITNSTEDSVCLYQLEQRLESIEGLCRYFAKSMAVDNENASSVTSVVTEDTSKKGKAKEGKRVSSYSFCLRYI